MLKNKNGELCLQIRIEAGDPHSCCGGRQAGTAATSRVYTDTHRHCVQRHCWLPATHTRQPQFLNVMLRSQSTISQGTYLQYSHTVHPDVWSEHSGDAAFPWRSLEPWQQLDWFGGGSNTEWNRPRRSCPR